MSSQLAFHFDIDCCSGCKACVIACKDKNDLPAGLLWRRVYEISAGKWEQNNNAWTHSIVAYNLSVSCNHCADPACLYACPANAIVKENNGVVQIDSDRCMGCKYCSWACPYGAMQYDNDKGQMSKCNLCYDYITDGKNPSCVDACPMRALDFDDVDNLRETYGPGDNFFPFPDPELCKPSTTFVCHRSMESDLNDPEIENLEEFIND